MPGRPQPPSRIPVPGDIPRGSTLLTANCITRLGLASPLLEGGISVRPRWRARLENNLSSSTVLPCHLISSLRAARRSSPSPRARVHLLTGGLVASFRRWLCSRMDMPAVSGRRGWCYFRNLTAGLEAEILCWRRREEDAGDLEDEIRFLPPQTRWRDRLDGIFLAQYQVVRLVFLDIDRYRSLASMIFAKKLGHFTENRSSFVNCGEIIPGHWLLFFVSNLSHFFIIFSDPFSCTWSGLHVADGNGIFRMYT